MEQNTRDPLGDGISKVELLWVKGDDLEVVNDARESMDKEHAEFVQPDDTRLIEYLASHNPIHWTPFGGSIIKLRLKMPLFLAREWFRHTIGFNRNEVSRRYVKSEPEFYLPEYYRKAPGKGQTKQGSVDEEHKQSGLFRNWAVSTHSDAAAKYTFMVDHGVAPEMARMHLPVSMYTEFKETSSLYALAHLVTLRDHKDAQLEIQKYARCVTELVEPYFPVAWPALLRGSKHTCPQCEAEFFDKDV